MRKGSWIILGLLFVFLAACGTTSDATKVGNPSETLPPDSTEKYIEDNPYWQSEDGSLLLSFDADSQTVTIYPSGTTVPFTIDANGNIVAEDGSVIGEWNDDEKEVEIAFQGIGFFPIGKIIFDEEKNMTEEEKDETCRVHPEFCEEDLGISGNLVVKDIVVDTLGDDDSGKPDISDDGSVVVFESEATNMVENDSNGESDIFMTDLETSEVEIISKNASGHLANGASSRPVISSDKSFVVFESTASNLVAHDTNDVTDVFIKELESGEVERVSVSVDGSQRINHSSRPSIGYNNKYVSFEGAGAGGTLQVFVRDLRTGEVMLASESIGGGESSGYSRNAVICQNMPMVAFESNANDLVVDDKNDKVDIFLKNLETGEMERISLNSEGEEGDDNSDQVSISADCRFVVFASEADNLDGGDLNGLKDVFIRDRVQGTTRRLSQPRGAGEFENSSTHPIISKDGHTVAFVSSAQNVVENDRIGSQNIYVQDVSSGSFSVVSCQTGEIGFSGATSESPRLSADGRYVVFSSDATLNIDEDKLQSMGSVRLDFQGDNGLVKDIFVRDLQENRMIMTNIPAIVTTIEKAPKKFNIPANF